MTSEAAGHADFSKIRYAQVWEDADVLLDGLDIGTEDDCLSIASAGDNALAMLARNPRSVLALDLNPAQLACLELRVAAFRKLDHGDILELTGSRPGTRAPALYSILRGELTREVREFWDANASAFHSGIGHAGKFENYFRMFRRKVLPLVHSQRMIDRLLEPKTREERLEFYEREWDTRRWRWLFHLFFSRRVMGALGRDPSFFRYVEGSVAGKILARVRHALTELEPDKNPYLQWILLGCHATALPFYLREENFDRIRNNLDRLEWRKGSLEDFLNGSRTFTKFNMSDVFEYMSDENAGSLFRLASNSARSGGRIAYWNMLAPRQSPESLREKIAPLADVSAALHLQDKAFFYSAFRVEVFA